MKRTCSVMVAALGLVILAFGTGASPAVSARSTSRVRAPSARSQQRARAARAHKPKPKRKKSTCLSEASLVERQCAGTVSRKLAREVSPDGAVSKQVALETFAAEVAPLPGVKAPSGQVGYVGDGTAAVNQVFAYWSQLSGPQRNAILAVIGRLVASARDSSSSTVARAAAELPGLGEAKAKALEYVNAFEAIFGKLHLHVYVASFPLLGDQGTFPFLNLQPGTYAETFALNAKWLPFGSPRRCVIDMNPNGPGFSISDQVLAHEVFHCFQAQFIDNISDWQGAIGHSGWLMEGGADYAACYLAPEPNNIVSGNVTNYYKSFATALFERDPGYDGVGFLDHLANALFGPTDNQVPTLKLIRAMTFAAGITNAEIANTDAFRLGVSEQNESTVLGTSASELFNDKTFQYFSEHDSCELNDPTTVGVKPTDVDVSTGSKSLPSTGELANGLYDLNLSTAAATDLDELRIEVAHGYVRIAGGSNKVNDLLGAGAQLGPTRTYCLETGGCNCPDGSPPSGVPTPDAQLNVLGAPPVHVAVSGDLDGGDVTLTGYTVNCTKEATVQYSGTITDHTVLNPGTPSIAETFDTTLTWTAEETIVGPGPSLGIIPGTFTVSGGEQATDAADPSQDCDVTFSTQPLTNSTVSILTQTGQGIFGNTATNLDVAWVEPSTWGTILETPAQDPSSLCMGGVGPTFNLTGQVVTQSEAVLPWSSPSFSMNFSGSPSESSPFDSETETVDETITITPASSAVV